MRGNREAGDWVPAAAAAVVPCVEVVFNRDFVVVDGDEDEGLFDRVFVVVAVWEVVGLFSFSLLLRLPNNGFLSSRRTTSSLGCREPAGAAISKVALVLQFQGVDLD